MPTYKVGFPYIVVDAPSEKAALAAYDQFIEGWGTHDGFGPVANIVEETADYTVDAEGNEIEEEEVFEQFGPIDAVRAYGCTQSVKHPGRCVDAGNLWIHKRRSDLCCSKSA